MSETRTKKIKKLTRFIVFAFPVIFLANGWSLQLTCAGMEKESPAKPQEMAKEFYEKGQEAKDTAEKESFYIKALEMRPNYPEAHNDLGDVYEKQGKYEKAIKEYEIASALAPNAPFPYWGLGDIYFKLGRYELAAANYEKGLRIEPDDKSAIERLRLSSILTTKILFSFNSYKLTDKAIEHLTLIAKALSSPEFEDTVFEIQGHTDSAGPEDYNLHLSQRRAEGVKKHLFERGVVPAEKLIFRGYGEDRPIASNKTKEGRGMNRRAEIIRILKY